MDQGSLTLAVVAAVLFLGGLFVERQLLRWRHNWYFSAGFPVFPELLPIPRAPEGSGETSTVSWEVVDGLVRFWADPAARKAPSGLHGAIRLILGPKEVRLVVRWSPPWSPLLAAGWLAGLGLVRGEGYFTVPIAAMIVLAVLFVYRQAAVRAARELRWAWVSQQ
ncbi:MAG: hypothetical protein HN348_00515 [Proteobacteria bacterium]|nr:hypothetical protein [Pseudomonadota bacterium]